MSFEENMIDSAIIRAVAGMRMNGMDQRHRAHFLANMIRTVKPPGAEGFGELATLVPGRRQWVENRPDLAGRKRVKAIGVMRQALERTMNRGVLLPAGERPDWAERLLLFCNRVRGRAISGLPFAAPDCRLISKPGPQKNGPKKKRLIATFTTLEERVLLALAARYLRMRVDGLFREHVCAFRHGREHGREAAVTGLRQFRMQFAKTTLWVAECDLKQFFDHVPHRAVLAEVDAALTEACGRPAREAEPVLTGIIERAVRAFDYNTLAPQLGLPPLLEERPGEPCGLPQGGSLSPVLANLVLRRADQAALNAGVGNSAPLFYRRFCDDMILVSPDRELCREAAKRYVGAIEESGLVAYTIEDDVAYGRELYSRKSKFYMWAARETGGAPWAGFLGYQIHWTGALRVRSESVDNHQDRLRQEARSVGRYLCAAGPANWRETPEELCASMHARLIRTGVGLTGTRRLADTPPQPCWADAFGLLEQNLFIRRQLKSLDRTRGAVVRQFKAALSRVAPQPASTRADLRAPGGPVGSEKRPYKGAPCSYYGFFMGSRTKSPDGDRGYGKRWI